MDPQWNGVAQPQYEHIEQNEFSYRRHRKQKEEDIATCECQFDPDIPESACGEDRCLNALTSTECTPGYCTSGAYCKNQRFQKCEYAKTRLFETEGRGWGLLADEDIKAGQFVIEYCGEVISWREARRRSQTYERLGIKDAFIISLNTSESIDATKKGSLARFINHSCQPNCETRKWTVLGEIRVGIFAKQDIPLGAELSYNYNFEWYGGAKVRCLCGAVSCSGFLGAKSRGFQEDTYLWEDDDDRYSVEKIPLYDSAEDEPSSKLFEIGNPSNSAFDIHGKMGYASLLSFDPASENQFESTDLVVQQLMDSVKSEDVELHSQNSQQAVTLKNAMVPRIRSNIASPNYHIDSGPMRKKQQKQLRKGRPKQLTEKQVDAKHVVRHLSLREAKEEVLTCEELKNDAAASLASLYDEIRPAVEEHEQESQDNVATDLAEKWIVASCAKLKAEFDLYHSVIKNIACTPLQVTDQGRPPAVRKGEGGESMILEHQR